MIDLDDEEDAGPAPEMNTTPLIDVLLALLIMIIVTIPLRPRLTELFQATRSAAPVGPPVVARLDVGADGAVRWDGAAAYGRVVGVLSAIRRRERIKFGLVGSGG